MARTPRAAVSLSLRIWLVDAFAQQPFSGNPAGVCLLERSAWPTEDWMRSFAAELKSETAFVYRVGEAPGGEWALRWFTAEAESNVCGHATLAAAHALRDEQPAHHAFSFRSPYGLLMARRREDGAITLDFPAASPVDAPTPAGLREALHGEPIATFGTGRLGDVLVVMRDEKTVRGLQPDFAALARLCRRDDVRGIIVTAEANRDSGGYDFVSRYFAPANGLDEDQVTGSAHTALAPYWSRRLGRESLTGFQVSLRTGIVRTKVRNDRVDLTGYATTTIEGLIPLVAAPEPSSGSVAI